jgi:regulator of protease activity HflC (stomatin/prohibitin superfamily)
MFAVVIGILLILAAIVAPLVMSANDLRGGGFASVVCILLAIVIVCASCISTVPTGHTGILSTFGRVEEKSLPNGMNFHAPWQDITTMTNKEQKSTNNGVCFSKDSQEVTYIYTTKHSLLPSATPNIYKTVGLDYYDILLKKQIENTIAIEFGLVEAENMTALFSQLQASVNKSVKAYAEGYGIIIDVVIDDFDFTDAYTNAIEAKQVAEQEALRDKTQQQMETERARQQAERTKIQAENDAEIRRINAEAEAEANKVKAQADFEVAQLEADAIAYKGQKEAEATAALAAVISDEIVAYEYAQRWRGELPQYMMGGNGALPIIDIPTGEEE